MISYFGKRQRGLNAMNTITVLILQMRLPYFCSKDLPLEKGTTLIDENKVSDK